MEIMEAEKTKVQYTFLQEAEKAEVEREIDYESLLDLSKQNLSSHQKEEDFSEAKDAIVFFCRDCNKKVEVNRLPPSKKYKVRFQCAVCHGEHVFYGTERGITEYFRSH